MTTSRGVWKRRKAFGDAESMDISHYFSDLQKYRTPSECKRANYASSEVTDEIKGITRRCMLCSAKVSGYGLLVGIRSRWDKKEPGNA